ncbi:MAG: octanoyltransferase [Deltaproteobacteria bacterium]|nr:MAG: octanoyltransferase [Deltaproteobacteria bacterium]
MRALTIHRLGRVAYGPALELQKRLQTARQRGEVGDTVLFVEHAPVITLGRGAKDGNVLLTPIALEARGFEVHEVGRGGDVTYHGPGQLVAYPIISLEPDRKDVRRYVRDLEETMIRVAADWGVTADRVDGLNGAWVGNDKVGAIGVRISRWVTMHGFAINVNTDLSHFQVIVPCGISGRGVTSLAEQTGAEVAMKDVEVATGRHLGDLFGAEVEFRDGPPELAETPTED